MESYFYVPSLAALYCSFSPLLCCSLFSQLGSYKTTDTGGSGNFVGKLVAFSPTLPVLSILKCRIKSINENGQKSENNGQ